MSDASMAAPVVSGAAALVLESNPNLTPDQVKYRLTATANKNWLDYDAKKAGARSLDIYTTIHSTTTRSANMGLASRKLLWTGTTPITWNSVNWDSVNWDSD